MKIALITSMKYGLTQFIFRDVKALIEKGNRVVLFPLKYNRGLYNPLPDWEVRPISKQHLLVKNMQFILRNPKLYLKLLRMAVRTRSFINLAMAIQIVDDVRNSDVIFAYFGDHKFFTGYYCKRITGIPLVVTIRAYELQRNPNPPMFIESLAYCDRVVTITEYNKSVLIEKYGVAEEKIDIVRQTLDLDLYKAMPKIKILIVGFFAAKKGHETLFKALKQLNRSDLEIWVVGDNVRGYAHDCRQIAKDLNLESQVAFFGVQSGTALRALYQECDIFCLPSRTDARGEKEGFPNVIAEAMAFGKPVISSRHAGIPEVVADEALVDEDDVDQLAALLQKACDSLEWRNQLGEQNRKQVEDMYSLRNIDRLESILQTHSKETVRPYGRDGKCWQPRVAGKFLALRD